MRPCEFIDQYDENCATGFKVFDEYLMLVRKQADLFNIPVKSLMNEKPLCKTHSDKTSEELKTLFENVEDTLPKSLIRPLFNTASYEVEFFLVRYKGIDKYDRHIFIFKDREISVMFYTNERLIPGNIYVILADFYYTLNDNARNYTYLSVADIKPATMFDIKLFNGELSSTHLDNIYICHPLNKTSYNFGIATKRCKEPTRAQIHAAIINDNPNCVTKDIIKIFANKEED